MEGRHYVVVLRSGRETLRLQVEHGRWNEGTRNDRATSRCHYPRRSQRPSAFRDRRERQTRDGGELEGRTEGAVDGVRFSRFSPREHLAAHIRRGRPISIVYGRSRRRKIFGALSSRLAIQSSE